MPTVDQVKNKVLRMMANNFEVKVDSDGDVVIRYESAVCWVSVRDWHSDKEGRNTIVQVRSPILWNVKMTPAVYQWVATEGQKYYFGAVSVGIDEGQTEGALWLKYSLLGDNLDAPELETAVVCVLGDANRLDDELQKKFGGKRTADL